MQSVPNKVLNKIYTNRSTFIKSKERFKNLIQGFNKHFPNESSKLAFFHAPGRINIIGEHTDYNGLPVLPIAIDRDIVAVISKRNDNRIVLANTSSSFNKINFTLAPNLPHAEKGSWENYVKAACQTVINYTGTHKLFGFNAVIDSTIPIAAGLSSSAALTVLITKILVELNKIRIDSLILAQKVAEGERYVGTATGGMDQTISLLGKPGHALKINFLPKLNVEPVKLPKNYSFVVSNSLVHAEKSGAVQQHYNRRVIECRLVCALIEQYLNINGYKLKLNLLGDLKKCLTKGTTKFKTGKLKDRDIFDLINLVLKKESYKLTDIAEILEITTNVLTKKYLILPNENVFIEPEDGFKLKPRCLHVLKEWIRLETAVRLMKKNDVKKLGKLLLESHNSLAESYEVSCPELNKLVKIALDSGAVGVRLTGAGFGGCVISLVKNTKVGSFIAKVKKEYYKSAVDETTMFVVTSTIGAGKLF